MEKSLVIVESPAKAKTINKYLGKNFIVKSSIGHVRDLPKGTSSNNESKTTTKSKLDKETRDKQNLIRRMGIDPYHDWKANYQILPDKHKVISELKKLAKDADNIYLATDLDREGEAIAWHLQEIIGGDSNKYKRVVFNEITKKSIQDAFTKPTTLDMNRVNAQQSRRFLDRVVGFNLSPLLWKKIARGLSAGRVQSVSLRLLVERELEIKSFMPEEFWKLDIELETEKKIIFPVDLYSFKDKKITIKNEKQASSIVEQLKKANYKIVDKEVKPTSVNPKPPFITSTLQQAASNRLGYGLKRTMMLAQMLYEAGYITYMRTDSTNISNEALTSVRDFINKQYGKEYLPAKAKVYASKSNAQEAHEAIRPSYVDVSGKDLVGMDPSAVKLYELIRNRFIACQMPAANYDSTSLTISADEYQLKAKGRVLKFDGWTKVMSDISQNNDENALPELSTKSSIKLHQIEPEQCFTKPPARYTEASLVKELEKSGIGRPSTYATIISTIQDRGYAKIKNRRFYVEKIGEIVVKSLQKSFPKIMDYNFTAIMENDLDSIATGEINWKKWLDKFYAVFEKALEKASTDEQDGGMPANKNIEIDYPCSICSRNLTIRTASTGVFLGCSGYALPVKERCKNTLNLIPEEEILNVLDDQAEAVALHQKKRCPKCDVAMDSYIIDKTKDRLYICGRNPFCEGYIIEKDVVELQNYTGPIVTCEKCGNEMHLKLGKFGKYMGCINPDCKNTRKILKSGEVAPPREDPVAFPELKCTKSDAYFVLRDGASGIFMAAHNFPKSRETRAVYVHELIKYKYRLPDKFLYLTEAPAKDPDGNLAIVRFSRKEKIQYVTSEKDGKPTKWKVYYQNGKWSTK